MSDTLGLKITIHTTARQETIHESMPSLQAGLKSELWGLILNIQ